MHAMHIRSSLVTLLVITPMEFLRAETLDYSFLGFAPIFGAPSAITSGGSHLSFGLNYVNPRGGVSGAGGDGDMSVTYGFGDPIIGAHFQVSANITSLTNKFGDSGNLELSASRMLFANPNTSIFIGASATGLAPWGDDSDWDPRSSIYISKEGSYLLSDSYIPYELTFGFSEENTLQKNGSLSDGIFYGLGLGITPEISISVSGNATQTNLGTYFYIPDLKGFMFSAGVLDAFNSTESRQLSLTASYSINMR